MSERHVRLKDVLRARHWTVYRTFCREYDKAATSIDAALIGTYPSRAQLHRWLKGDVKRLPYPDHCRVLECMFGDWTAEQLFELCDPHCGQNGKVPSGSTFADGVARSIQTGLRRPDTDRGSWTQQPPGPGRPGADRLAVDLREVPLPEMMARKITSLGHVLRLTPDEITELASLAGNLVDLSLAIDLHIAVDGLCSVTYRYHSVNLTDRPVNRAPRDLWFQHSRGPLELVALRESPTKNAIQRLHTADNIAKFACQLSPAIQPGEAARFGYTCSGAEFRTDYYWRHSFARYTKAYTLRVRHDGLTDLAGITATEELPDGTETLARQSVEWDYDGDTVVMTFTRDHLQPNQYATLRWETA